MIRPRPAVQRLEAYVPPKEGRAGRIRLDFNENTEGPSPRVMEAIRDTTGEELCVYPEYDGFMQQLAESLGIRKERLLLTNGADEGIKKAIDTFLDATEEILIPTPTFDMFALYAEVAGARIREVSYNTDLSFPTDRVKDSISTDTRILVLVSPNNPTGTPIAPDDVRSLLETARENNTLVILDEAYYQFSDDDFLPLIEEYENLIIVRTFSKIFGLAGLRLGYIVGNEQLIADITKAGSPYNVSSLAIRAGSAALNDTTYIQDYVRRVRENREYLSGELTRRGFTVQPSQANFILVNMGRLNDFLVRKLREHDILIRNRGHKELLANCSRISIGTRTECDALLSAMDKALEPVILFDMDGVLADVSESYRTAIRRTAERLLAQEVSTQQIQELKEEGGFNNDWELTQELIRRQGGDADFEEVKDTFQSLYLGSTEGITYEGLIHNESLAIEEQLLQDLARRYRLGIVTGRPRREAEFFLANCGISDLFSTMVSEEDAPVKGKPAPDGINEALEELDAATGYYMGDSVDDMIAAREAGLTAVGIIPPGMDERQRLAAKLSEGGAYTVLATVNEISQVIR